MPEVAQVNHTEITFRCPECGESNLCEVARALNYSWISSFYSYPHSNMWYPDYYDGDTEVTDVIRTECSNCGFTVCEGYANPNLGALIIERGWIQEEGQVSGPRAEEPTWEV